MCAALTGVVGFLYALSFIVISRSAPATGALLSALFLLLFGLTASAALTALYQQLRRVDPAFALWALLLGMAGSLGAAIHGGHDLAVALHPPTALNTDAPSQVDPRGLLTFGVSGIALFVASWLLGRLPGWPAGLSILGYASAALLVVLYLGRLIVLDATSPVIVGPALLNGFVLQPVWYVWLGLTLWRAHGEP
jgi:hypothetical protein